MKKFIEKVKHFFKTYVKEVGCVALFLFGALFLIVGTNNFIRGLSFACWAGCVFIMREVYKLRGQSTISNFDKEAKEILKDIEINGEDSEYYGVVDENIIGKQRLKLTKKIEKERVSFTILGAILLIISILCVI